mmetsp:Transcript_8935/g.13348  ORF Transcript_8935/g.13348 Transcript_8935/m.13348 type:complete len:217 (+) Transcript_8935:182-832(+)
MSASLALWLIWGLAAALPQYGTPRTTSRLRAFSKASSQPLKDLPKSSTRRRSINGGLAGSLSTAVLLKLREDQAAAQEAALNYRKLSTAEWRERLTPEQFYILIDRGTERPFSSPLYKEKRAGTFYCAGCDTPLFESTKKFDSGTGWPSFYDRLPGVSVKSAGLGALVGLGEELECKTCGGHLGDRFNDGILWSVPTGYRYCIDGYALRFEPKNQV